MEWTITHCTELANIWIECINEWLGGMTPELLFDRGWAPAVTFCSVGVAMVIFALQQTFTAAKEFAEIQSFISTPDAVSSSASFGRRLRTLSRMQRRRLHATQQYLKFLRLIEIVGTGHFVALSILLFLYFAKTVPESVIRITVFSLLAPTLCISWAYLYYRIFGYRLH
jgi:hypothetical protein